MKSKNFIYSLLLFGGMATAFSSCGDDITIEPEPTQAEINIQKLETFKVANYRFHSASMNLNGSGLNPAMTNSYSIEYPYIVVELYYSTYRFNMNQLIAFNLNSDMSSLSLYFP